MWPTIKTRPLLAAMSINSSHSAHGSGHGFLDQGVLPGEQTAALASGKWCLTGVATTTASTPTPLSKC